MGTDVHGIWQARKDGRWIDIESKWEQDRHYLLFSWLANVRNGFGFAGVPTYDPVVPIAMPRGYPVDFSVEDDYHGKDVWLGDHTHSWLTVDEIIAAPVPKIQRTGVVSVEFYNSWDRKTPPESWSESISGPDVRVANSPKKIRDNTTHVQIEWDSGNEVIYFVEEVRRLKELHGEVRLVFGFDS